MTATEQSWTLNVVAGESRDAVTALAELSGLSRSAVKQAMLKGAVWLRRGGKEKRLRITTAALVAGDRLQLCYDPQVLALKPEMPELVADNKRYSLWHKPAGMLAQGSRFGDHCALDRLVEQHLNRQSLLVHRLDRETSGLMLLAHDGKMAAALSAELANGDMFKAYLALVKGELSQRLWLDQPIDDQSAETEVEPLHFDPARNLTLVAVRLLTGRTHQIRRHLTDAGLPVWGDPRYGSGNKNSSGLALQAQALAFHCPLLQHARRWQAPLPGWLPAEVDGEMVNAMLQTLYQRHQDSRRWG